MENMLKDIDREIARANKKISLELEEIKKYAQSLLECSNNATLVIHGDFARKIAESERILSAYAAKRETLMEVWRMANRAKNN